MNPVTLHQTTEAIEGLKLKWDMLHGETRHASFTQSYAWFRLASRLLSPHFAPIVIEARHDSGTLGLLPLLSDRKRDRWISPQLLFGFGNAAPVGSQPTATWLQIGRHLRDRMSAQHEWQLGPFPHGSGASSRLSTAFDQLVIPQVANSKTAVSTIQLDQRELRWKNEPGASTIANTDQQWHTLISCPRRQGGEAIDWNQLDRLAHLIPSTPVTMSLDRRGPLLDVQTLKHVCEELGPEGLAHLLVHRQDNMTDFAVLVLGSKSEAVLMPLGPLPSSASHRPESFAHEALSRLRHCGFERATIHGRHNLFANWSHQKQTLYSYWYASQWNTHVAFKQLWHRVVPPQELRVAP